MQTKRRKFDSAFKARVAIEALKERETLQQLSVKFELHPNQISQWKQEFVEKATCIFEKKPKREDLETDLSTLYHKIGELQMEKDFLKKNLKRFGLL